MRSRGDIDARLQLLEAVERLLCVLTRWLPLSINFEVQQMSVIAHSIPTGCGPRGRSCWGDIK